MTKPISPKEVAAYKAQSFPDYVFEAFNELIAANFSAGSATVKQKDVKALIIAKSGNAALNVVERGYMNVEEVYREQGWKVEYDKPAYYEDYDAYFKFRSK
ncbi:MAG: hypothetical protein EOO38_02330 [Cytophagaceae bacterium]|nr:MAG: hypothetical protein EOO38_02330 [Cytophagaceae bacterium]